jgi:hypothetical protein
MTKNMWISVPAGALGQGGADVRPFGDVAVRAAAQAPVAVRQGSGLPATRLRDLGGYATPCTPRGEFIAQNDGTTLGFSPSSRPLS